MLVVDVAMEDEGVDSGRVAELVVRVCVGGRLDFLSVGPVGRVESLLG